MLEPMHCTKPLLAILALALVALSACTGDGSDDDGAGSTSSSDSSSASSGATTGEQDYPAGMPYGPCLEDMECNGGLRAVMQDDRCVCTPGCNSHTFTCPVFPGLLPVCTAPQPLPEQCKPGNPPCSWDYDLGRCYISCNADEQCPVGMLCLQFSDGLEDAPTDAPRYCF
jgi:hypothetical protein